MISISKGSRLLLFQIANGEVFRDDKGFWVIASGTGKRSVHLRIMNLMRMGLVSVEPKLHFPKLTTDGVQALESYLKG